MQVFRNLFLATFTVAASISAQAADEAADQRAILEVIDAFFLALHAGDGDAFEALMQDHARTVIVRTEGEGPAVTVRENSAGTIARMRSGEWAPFRESYWSPTVLQRGRLAMVWLPYVLIRDEGGFSHCGIDQFTLTRSDRWRIDFVAFTIEPTRAACAELGQPSDPAALRPRFSERKSVEAEESP